MKPALLQKFGLTTDRLAAAASLAVRILAAGLAAILQVVLARLLGADDYGVFAWAWALVTVGGYATTFGLSQTAVRFLAGYAERNNAAAARGFIRFAVAAVLTASGFLAAAGALVFASLGSGWVEPIRYLPLLIVFATIPFFALGDLAEGFARSQGWTLLALTPGYVLRQVLLIALIAGAFALGRPATATTGLWLALAATAATALLHLLLVLARLRPMFGAGSGNSQERPAWLSAALPVFLADMVQVLRQNLDVLILAAFAAPAEVAVYFAATRIASLLGLVEFAVGAAAAHRFARMDRDRSSSTLARVVRDSAALTFWPTLAAALALCAAAPILLSLFGSDYRAASGIVLILAIAAVLRSAIGPADDLLTMQGFGAMNLAGQAVGLAVTLVAALALVPAHGPLGAALAVLLATCATTVTLALISGRRIGVVPLPLSTRFLARRQPA